MCADVIRSETPPGAPNSPLGLAGRVAVVTGAGRGLGKAGAMALAAAGARLVLIGRTAAPLYETANEIAAAGGQALAILADVTDEPSVQQAAARVETELGGADILVNNAGTAHVQPLLETPLSEVQRLLSVNVVGALACARAFGAQMIRRGGGRVINVASISALVGEPNVSAYAASKGALVALTRSLAVEWARHGITVNALAPGYFHTDLNAQALEDPQIADRILKKIPLRRVGKPAELGPLLVYLASDASAFMTGSVLVIDGGQVAR